ncbi:hypothetical protein ACU8KH_05344 [Lachancea thermotolerans]
MPRLIAFNDVPYRGAHEGNRYKLLAVSMIVKSEPRNWNYMH